MLSYLEINFHLNSRGKLTIPDDTEGYISRGKIGEKEEVFLNTYHPRYLGFEDNGNLKRFVLEIFTDKL